MPGQKRQRGDADIRSRKWFLTCNNPTKEHEATFAASLKHVKYGLSVHEIGKKRGTPHMHCWLHFEEAKSWTYIMKAHPGCDVRAGKGTDAHAKAYLSKENEPTEVGTPTAQGKRNDIAEVREILQETNSMRTVVQNVNSYQAVKFGELYLKYAEEPRPYGTRTVKWYWGPAGRGKTYAAEHEYPDAYKKSGAHKWWDGYDGHKVVIFDDIRGDFCKFHEMLTMTGEMAFRVENKGGSRQALYDTVIVTSCFRPTALWETIEDKDQLLGRITEIKEFDGPDRRMANKNANTEVAPPPE